MNFNYRLAWDQHNLNVILDHSNAPMEILSSDFTPNYTQSSAYVRILEQPSSKPIRFRYPSEERVSCLISGANSTTQNKTFPTIEIYGATGRAKIIVSCVIDEPHNTIFNRPHPHHLIGEDCKDGVCITMISASDEKVVSFRYLGIQCVTKRDIVKSLGDREKIGVDPFKTGFYHKNDPSSIDLNVVRLCFEVVLEDDQGNFTIPLRPVVSDPVYDIKAMTELKICKLSDCYSPVNGNKDIILLCEKVKKDDIAIRFFDDEQWEASGTFNLSDVHKQVAIAFKTPAYKNMTITEPVEVWVQLVRISNGFKSEPFRFLYTPIDNGQRKNCMSLCLCEEELTNSLVEFYCEHPEVLTK